MTALRPNAKYRNTAVGLSAFAFGALALPSAARAAPPPASASAPAAPKESATAQADAHFKRGVELYKEKAFEAAMVEFRRANQLAPSYRVLYNVARCHVELKQLADALNAYRAYLQQGGGEVTGERRAQVDAEIARLEKRTARVTVVSDTDGVEVAYDDQPIGTTPIKEPVVVDPGRRRFSFEAPGYLREARVVEVVAGDAVTVRVEMHKESAATVAQPDPATSSPNAPPTEDGARLRPAASSSSRATWNTVGLVTTGLLAAGAVTTGVLALTTTSTRNKALARGPGDPDELSRLSSNAKTFAVVTDVLIVSAAVVGSATLIHIFATRKHDEAPGVGRAPRQPTRPVTDVGVGITPGALFVSGTF